MYFLKAIWYCIIHTMSYVHYMFKHRRRRRQGGPVRRSSEPVTALLLVVWLLISSLMCIYRYIYIYTYTCIYIYIYRERERSIAISHASVCLARVVVSTMSCDTPDLPFNIIPLTLLDSHFPGNPLWTWEFHPLELRLCLSRILWNP